MVLTKQLREYPPCPFWYSPLAHAQLVFEDAYLMIHESDGESWADALRYRMHDSAEDPLSPSELTSLLLTPDAASVGDDNF